MCVFRTAARAPEPAAVQTPRPRGRGRTAAHNMSVTRLSLFEL